METITPKDVRDVAAKYFVDDNRTIVTLATKAKETAKTEGSK
jgi:predicted Zn-dependent peptidase